MQPERLPSERKNHPLAHRYAFPLVNTLQFVFLVGGFGTSPYLKARLASVLYQLQPGCEIITPRHAYADNPSPHLPHAVRLTQSNSEQAVVLGCLYTHLQRLRKEEDPVSQRLCRASLGVVALKAFNPATHAPEERYVHPVTGQELALNQIMWLCKKVCTLLRRISPGTCVNG